MAQARQTHSTRAVDSLSDSNPKALTDNMSIVKTEDGAVILSTALNSGSITSRRVDSEGDLDHIQKGGKVWWQALLKEQTARDAAKVAPAPKAKAKGAK